jgi:hypothetical protein
MDALQAFAVSRRVPIEVTEQELAEHVSRMHARLAKPFARLIPELLQQERDGRLIAASYSYSVHPVGDVGAGRVRLDDGATFDAPLVAHLMKPAKSLVFAVMSLGAGLAQHASEFARSGSLMRVMVIEDMASIALAKLGVALVADIEVDARGRGWTCSGAINPGESGFDIANQRFVLDRAGAAGIGVELTDSGSMSPMHSISGVFGLGKNMRKWTQVENCERCNARDRCRQRLALAR